MRSRALWTAAFAAAVVTHLTGVMINARYLAVNGGVAALLVLAGFAAFAGRHRPRAVRAALLAGLAVAATVMAAGAVWYLPVPAAQADFGWFSYTPLDVESTVAAANRAFLSEQRWAAGWALVVGGLVAVAALLATPSVGTGGPPSTGPGGPPSIGPGGPPPARRRLVWTVLAAALGFTALVLAGLWWPPAIGYPPGGPTEWWSVAAGTGLQQLLAVLMLTTAVLLARRRVWWPLPVGAALLAVPALLAANAAGLSVAATLAVSAVAIDGELRSLAVQVSWSGDGTGWETAVDTLAALGALSALAGLAMVAAGCVRER